ncbi:MAG: pilus assembly protein PilM [Planctomycetota bacterium]
MNHSENILGVHIDDDFLNIVHLGHTANGLRLFDSAAVPLKEGVVKDGQIINTESVSKNIQQFVTKARPKPNKVVMLPSCATVRLKPSQFPVQAKDELQKQVEEQISEYTFFGKREIVFDYCVFAAQNADTQTVLEAVTTRQTSDAYLKLTRQARLDLLRITPAIMPLIKLTLDKASPQVEEVALLLALESASGNIIVFKNGRPHLCQNLSIGVNDVLSNQDSITSLAEKLKPVLGFAQSIADQDLLVLNIAASCSGDKLSEIVNRITPISSGVKVEQINPADIIKQLDIKGADNLRPSIFAFTCALAALDVYKFAGQINLVSHDSLSRHKTRNEMSVLTKSIIAVILLSIVATYPIEMKLQSVEASSAEIQVKIAETIPMKRKVVNIKKQIKQVKEHKAAYAAAFDMFTDTPWSQILRDITENIPNDVRILDLSSSIDSTSFVIIGQALAESNVYSFAKKLANSEFIDTTKVDKVEYSKDGIATLLNYKITCKIHLTGSNL